MFSKEPHPMRPNGKPNVSYVMLYTIVGAVVGATLIGLAVIAVFTE